MKTITLCWRAKVGNAWRFYPALFEKRHGAVQVRHGWVKVNGELVEFPQGRYYLRTYREGRKHYEPVDTCNPRDAVIALERARKADRAVGSTRDARTYLKNAIPAYIADLGKQQHLEAQAQARVTLNEFISLPMVRATAHTKLMAREHVLAFHEALRKRGQSERTVANKHDRLKSFLRWCKVDVSFMPPAPKYDKGLPTIYEPGELKAILEAADPHMRVVILMALKLGLRELEIAHAEWNDVHWDDSVFRVQGKEHWKFRVKDKEERDIPIPADVLVALREWHEKHPKSRLIVGTESDKPNYHLLRTLKRLARRAELNCGKCRGCKSKSKECGEWTLHEFRRTYCTTLLRQGVDARTVQAWAGHADLATTLRYLRPAAAKEAQEKINAVAWGD